MKTIKYDPKHLNAFVMQAFITPLDKILEPVIMTTFFIRLQKTTNTEKEYLKKLTTIFALRIKKGLVARFWRANKGICDHALVRLTSRQ